jgi:hypothetical protein
MSGFDASSVGNSSFASGASFGAGPVRRPVPRVPRATVRIRAASASLGTLPPPLARLRLNRRTTSPRLRKGGGGLSEDLSTGAVECFPQRDGLAHILIVLGVEFRDAFPLPLGQWETAIPKEQDQIHQSLRVGYAHQHRASRIRVRIPGRAGAGKLAAGRRWTTVRA